jgi:hypothetical protein
MDCRVTLGNDVAARLMRQQEVARHEGEDQDDQEEDEEDREQNFRDAAGEGGNIGEAERAGDERNDQKNDRPFEHGNILVPRCACDSPPLTAQNAAGSAAVDASDRMRGMTATLRTMCISTFDARSVIAARHSRAAALARAHRRSDY